MGKINITEILKDCPKDTELYSPIFGNVYLYGIRPHLAVIVKTSDGQKEEFLYDGRFGINGECMLFPSKENRDWSTFQKSFKDGDIVATNSGTQVFILQRAKSNTKGYCYTGYDFEFNEVFDADVWEFERLATEEEKEKLFKAIKDRGYKWNPETKTLESITLKFKIGDRVRSMLSSNYYTIVDVKNNYYSIKSDTEKHPFQISFGSAIYYELVPNKFDISTLKPFDKVLVRCSSSEKWDIQVFKKYNRDSNTKYPFICLYNNKYNQCVPFEGNEYLFDTTNECYDYYKNW